MGRKQSGGRQRVYILLALGIIVLASGSCAGLMEKGDKSRQLFSESEALMTKGDYHTPLKNYQQILKLFPSMGDQALFKTAIIYAHPKNTERDYQKSLECFQRVIKEYQYSDLKNEAETTAFLINEVTNADKKNKALQKHIDSLERQVQTLERQVETLEQQITQMKEIDFSLEEKKKKRIP